MCWHFGKNKKRIRLFEQYVHLWWNLAVSVRPRSQMAVSAVETNSFLKTKGMSEFKIRTVILIIFSVTRIVAGQAINQKYYVELLLKFQERIQRQSMELWETGWILHQHNAPLHHWFGSFWLKIMFLYIPHSISCSMKFLPFPKLKCSLKWTYFPSIGDFQKDMREQLKEFWKMIFRHASRCGWNTCSTI